MKKLKIGILGYGKMGSVYAYWFSRNSLCEVYAVYNRTYEKISGLNSIYPGIKLYSEWQKLVEDPEMDVVCLCTPSNERLPQLEYAIQQGKHVVCEKPMCMDIDECKKITMLSRGAKQKIIVASELKYHPVIIEAGKLLPSIGRIFHIDFSFSMYRTEIKWKHLLQSGGGILRELCGHFLDVAGEWLGEAKTICGHNKIVLPGREVEDFTLNIIEYDSGASLCVESHYFERKQRTYNGRIYGTAGEIEFQLSSYDPEDSYLKIYTDEGCREVEIQIPQETDKVYPGHLDSFKRQLDSAVESILYDKDVSGMLVTEMKTMQIIDASYLSQKLDAKIKLPLEGFSHRDLKESYKVF